jgi:hypothetical protein
MKQKTRTVILIGMAFVLMVISSSCVMAVSTPTPRHPNGTALSYPTLDTINYVDIAASVTALYADPMELVKMAASATAKALNVTPVPSLTLPPGVREWQFPADDFSMRLVYDATRWARTDANTLASLQITGCTLRQAGGRSLGPGWSTEETTFHTEMVSFLAILAKYEDTPKFKTYSALPNGPVFEITSDSEFERCMQDGESVLKSISRQ